jgi:hypothetical protein
LLEASEKWRSEKKFNAYPQNSAKQELNLVETLGFNPGKGKSALKGRQITRNNNI